VGLSEKIRFVFKWTSTTSFPSRRDTTSGLGVGRGLVASLTYSSWLGVCKPAAALHDDSRAMHAFSLPIRRFGGYSEAMKGTPRDTRARAGRARRRARA
jgi:hypothetical protein